MRKIFIIIFVLSSTLAFSQKEAKNKIVDFNPAFRFGFQLPIQFGNNYFSKDLSSGFGFHSTLSLVKIYNFRLSLGYEFQKLKVENSNAIGNFDYINSNSYQYILEYEIPFGLIGKLFDKLLLENHLINFIKYRNSILKELSENQHQPPQNRDTF